MLFGNLRALVPYVVTFICCLTVAPTLWADCDLTMNCSSCSSGGFTLKCSCSVSGATIACCCSDPPAGVCSAGCGGCCRTIQEGQQTRKVCQGYSCIGSSCGGFNCQNGRNSGSAVIARSDRPVVIGPSWARTAGVALLPWPMALQAAAALTEVDLPVIVLPGQPVSLSATGKVGERRIENLRVTIRNHGNVPITAFVVRWEVDLGLGFKAISATSFDSFLGRFDVRPGESTDVESGGVLTAPSKVFGVRAVLSFVELADGSMKGDDTFVSLLKSRRSSQLAVYRDILRTVETDGRNVATKEKVESALGSTEFQKTCEGRDAVVIMSNLLRSQGAEKVLVELRRPRSYERN